MELFDWALPSASIAYLLIFLTYELNIRVVFQDEPDKVKALTYLTFGFIIWPISQLFRLKFWSEHKLMNIIGLSFVSAHYFLFVVGCGYIFTTWSTRA